MKELSIEQKAKCYDEALKVLHKYDGANIMFSQSLKEEMFPELKESEDDVMKKKLLELVAKHCGKTCEMYLWLEKQGNLMKSLQISNARIGELIEENYYLKEKQGEQKPAWSEEDKNMLQSILDEYKSMPTEKRNWLKSLKERYTWKPSELQIEALESATKNCAYSEYQDCLRELSGQLKKLRER